MSLPGFQTVPVRNSSGPISAMAGTPLAKRKTQIRATARIETPAAAVKSTFATVSLMLFITYRYR